MSSNHFHMQGLREKFKPLFFMVIHDDCLGESQLSEDLQTIRMRNDNRTYPAFIEIREINGKIELDIRHREVTLGHIYDRIQCLYKLYKGKYSFCTYYNLNDAFSEWLLTKKDLDDIADTIIQTDHLPSLDYKSIFVCPVALHINYCGAKRVYTDSFLGSNSTAFYFYYEPKPGSARSSPEISIEEFQNRNKKSAIFTAVRFENWEDAINAWFSRIENYFKKYDLPTRLHNLK